jgi:hypothetical protein
MLLEQVDVFALPLVSIDLKTVEERCPTAIKPS